MTLKTTSSVTVANSMRLPRKPEFDALRGLFLIWMTLTHLPTHLSDWVNQPFGFISSAEGFVFLSALLVGRISMRQAESDGGALRSRLWKRALKIYGYHVTMLVLAFTFAAAFAVYRHHVALENLLSFYLAHPVVAIIGSALLIYCPPLLDILPLYVIFLLVSPFLFGVAVRWGWRPILGSSILIWILAQFHLRIFAHDAIVRVTHLSIPLQEWGAFNVFAWQMVWIVGIWMGARSADGPLPFHAIPRWVNAFAIAICVFCICVRFDLLGPHLTQEHLEPLVDKWQEGPLRVLNIAAFMCIIYSLRGIVRWAVSHKPLITLGSASMEVFCAHLFFVFVGLALLYGEVPQLHGVYALSLLVATFIGLAFVAQRHVRRKYEKKESAARTSARVSGTASWLEGA